MNLPSKQFIIKQTVLIGGELLIVGLSPDQAGAILAFAKQKRVEGEGENKIKRAHPLQEFEIDELKKKGCTVPEESIALYLGHTVDCHKPLFSALGPNS